VGKMPYHCILATEAYMAADQALNHIGRLREIRGHVADPTDIVPTPSVPLSSS